MNEKFSYCLLKYFQKVHNFLCIYFIMNKKKVKTCFYKNSLNKLEKKKCLSFLLKTPKILLSVIFYSFLYIFFFLSEGV